MTSAGQPQFHFVAPRGWMNDPCAPGYDPETGKYHLMYQWNPYSHVWDNISWGAATSPDLVSWEYSSEEPVFVPDQPYDQRGIFTGCLYPTLPTGGPGLSIFYTSAAAFPIQWSKPHIRGSEGVALAVSEDGGVSWTKSRLNPIVTEEPADLAVTGFRDPYVSSRWPAMDRVLGHSSVYALLSGGVQEGPRLFLYTLDPSDLAKWTFHSVLANGVPRNFCPNPKWAGDFGANWECGGFMELSQGDETRTAWVVGVEGANVRPHVQAYRKANPAKPERPPRFLNWFFSDLTTTDEGTHDISIGATGCVDWGELYALATFSEPDGRRLAWGWLVEQDISDVFASSKGWIGSMGVPRELHLAVYEGVVGTLASPLKTITSFDVSPGEGPLGTKVTTLGIRPIAEITQLRRQSVYKLQSPSHASTNVLNSAPLSYDLELTAALSASASALSLVIRASQDGKYGTIIQFLPQAEELWIRRRHSTDSADVNTQDELAPFTLLRQRGPNGQVTLENLHMRVLVDRDIVEVFVNGRCAIATRVYTPTAHTGIALELDGAVKVRELKVWEMGSIGLVQDDRA